MRPDINPAVQQAAASLASKRTKKKTSTQQTVEESTEKPKERFDRDASREVCETASALTKLMKRKTSVSSDHFDESEETSGGLLAFIHSQ